jgi:hypothetical protein
MGHERHPQVARSRRSDRQRIHYQPALQGRAIVRVSPPPPQGQVIAEGTWAATVRGQFRFARIHDLATELRAVGGFGASGLLPDGAPGWGYA